MPDAVQVTGTLFDHAPYEPPPELSWAEWEKIRRIYEITQAWREYWASTGLT
jgi:hypothetical protein